MISHQKTSPDLGKSGKKMNITSLTLHNFRNYTKQTQVFGSDKVVFVGDNGRGKTNLLEAISVFSVGKSWREITETIDGERKCNLIQSGTSAEIPAAIEITTAKQDMYSIQVFPRKRVFQKNGKQIPRKNHIGAIPSLLFAPEHLDIFAAAKRERQRFFDRFLCQLYPQYKDLLSQTLRVIKQKNTIFREPVSDSDLRTQIGPWNEIISKNIPQIWKYREEFLSELEPLLQTELAKIAGNRDIIEVFLTRSGFENHSRTCISPDSVNQFELDFDREIHARRSLFTPTRDDFTFYYRGQSIMNTVSRGEIRSVLLALLSAKKQLFFTKKNVMPMLLLDDCFSELDDNRQQGLERLCEGTQAFFTTTHAEHFAQFSHEVQTIAV